MYDLTSFLTTIAGASASIVAILGGFIASKLLNLSSEREVVLSKIRNLEEEQQFKQNALLELVNAEKEESALYFIKDHIKDLLDRKKIEKVYCTNEQYDISLRDLTPYWEKALGIYAEMAQADFSLGINSDWIPNPIAEKYKEDEFAYEVCKKIIKAIEKERKRKERENAKRNSPFGITPAFSTIADYDFEVSPVVNPLIKNADRNRIIELETELKWIKLQKKQLLMEKDSLKKPKGMVQGLIIFAIFAVACIIVPLILCPRYFTDPIEFWTMKIVILALFVLGLAAIFGYLIYLLKWDE